MVELFRRSDKRRHQYFTSIIEDYESESKRIYRILLIGSGESGKTTFLKQMKLLSSSTKTFSHQYRMNFLNELHLNAVNSMVSILKFMEDQKILFSNESSDILTAKSYLMKVHEEITKRPADIEIFIKKDYANIDERNFYDHIETLWTDENVKLSTKRGMEFNLIDNAEYVLNRLEEMRSISYVPTDQDVIFCRTKTYGIHNEKITYGGINFEMIDVGGQQDERAKWIEAMSDGITAVIFLTDVSAYDRNLLENSRVNRLRDSITLLGQVWKKTPLAQKSIILFLNKQDRLESKIRDKTCTFAQHFPEFEEGSIEFLNNFLYQLSRAIISKKSEDELWNRVFGYFLTTFTTDENIIKEEYISVKNIISKWMEDNLK